MIYGLVKPLSRLKPQVSVAQIYIVQPVTAQCKSPLSLDTKVRSQVHIMETHLIPAGAGTVLQVGEHVTGIQPGDKVLLSYSICRVCKQCCSGHRAYCEKILALNFSGKRADGSTPLSLPDGQALFSNFFGQSSFSDLAIVNGTSLIKVPSDTPLQLFASLGCSMQTGVGAILNTLDVQQGSSVAVFGVGSLGLYAIMACKLRQAREIIAIDIQPSRLDLAKELGATAIINSAEGDVAEQIRKLCGTNGVERALDCSGVAKIIETMIESLGTRGKACSVGSNAPGTRISIDVHKHFVRGTQYVGSHQGDSDPHKVSVKSSHCRRIHADGCTDGPIAYEGIFAWQITSRQGHDFIQRR
jgi:Zn-dependent alcohol dehydrogenase